MSLAAIGFVAKEHLNTANPLVFYSEETLATAPMMDLNKEGFHFGIAGYLETGVEQIILVPEQVLQYITPVARVYFTESSKTELNKANIGVITEIKYVKCSQVKDHPSLKFLFGDEVKDLTTNFGLCPDIKPEDEWKVAGSFLSGRVIMAQLIILPCSLANPLACVTDPVMLSKFRVEMVHPQTGIDITNIRKPVSTSPLIETGKRILRGMTKHYRFMMKKVLIKDLTTMLHNYSEKECQFLEINSKEIDFSDRTPTKLTCTEVEVINSSCEPYLTVTLLSSGVKQTYQRSYPKLVSALGKIGGVLKSLAIFGVILTYLYNTKFMDRALNKNMFGSKTNFNDIQSLMCQEEQFQSSKKSDDEPPTSTFIKLKPSSLRMKLKLENVREPDEMFLESDRTIFASIKREDSQSGGFHKKIYHPSRTRIKLVN